MSEIRAMLESRSRDRDRIERTLTDGYAHALSLEAERWRVQKRIRALVAGIDGDDSAGKTQELSELSRRIELHDGAIDQLREVLTRLRNEYQATSRPGPRRRRSAASG